MRSGTWIRTIVLMGGMVLAAACKKEATTPYHYTTGDSARISITNISPSIANLQLFVNNQFFPLPDSPIVFGATATVTFIVNPDSYHADTFLIPYVNIKSGYQQLAFMPDVNGSTVSVVNNYFEPYASYSLFLTDTLIHGKVTSVLVKDNIIQTDTSKCQLRFLNLAPNAPPLDIWAYPDAGYDGYRLFSDCAYLPNDFNSFQSAQSFSILQAGLYYFEATLAGTNNIVSGGYLYLKGRNAVTLFTKGYLTGYGTAGLAVGVIQYQL